MAWGSDKNRNTVSPLSGERLALTNERIAILEAQRAEDKSQIRDHIDGCTEKWAKAEARLEQLSDRMDKRFDTVETTRRNQHRQNLAMMGSILIAIIGGFATAFTEYMLHIK